MKQISAGESGFSFIEILVVLLLMSILVAIAIPNFFGAETDAKKRVDLTNVSSINASLALYKYNNSGSCPADATAFDTFMSNTTYFPDGKPTDPWVTAADKSKPYKDTYSASLCRVTLSVTGPPAVNHNDGTGH